MSDVSIPSAFVRLVRSSVAQFFWGVLRRLPVALACGVFFGTALAGVVWLFLVPREQLGSTAWMVAGGLIGLYVAAGLLWALQRAIHRAADQAIGHFQSESSALFDPLVELMLRRLPHSDLQIDIAHLRSCWSDATSRFGWRAERASRWSIPGRLVNRLVRRCLESHTAAVRETLDELARSGQTHVTAKTLADHVRDRLLAALANIARGQLTTARVLCRAVVVLLLVLPAGAAAAAKYWLTASG